MKGPQHLRILTYYDKRRAPGWINNVEYLQSLPDDFARLAGKRLQSCRHAWLQLVWALRLLRISRAYDVVLVGSDRVGLMFSALQRMVRDKRVPVIFIDFLINIDRNLKWKSVKRMLYRLAAKGASRIMVQRTCEVRLYSQELGVAPEKFVFVPYHSTIFNTPHETKDSGYIFACGDTHRDYALFFDALRDIKAPVIIAALQAKHFVGADVPPNVHIRSATEREYVQLMAEAGIIVIPLRSMPHHIGGEQTYINAMSMGKPTIVTDLDANDYIQDGHSGLLVAAGDANALRGAMLRVLTNPEFARELGAHALRSAAFFSPERFFERVFALCDEVAGQYRTDAISQPDCGVQQSRF